MDPLSISPFTRGRGLFLPPLRGKAGMGVNSYQPVSRPPDLPSDSSGNKLAPACFEAGAFLVVGQCGGCAVILGACRGPGGPPCLA